jgi:hypothetical protein
MASPPSADTLIDLLRRTMDPAYWSEVEADPARLGLHRGMAEVFAMLGARIQVMKESGYFLPRTGAGAEPATFARRSTFEVDLHRETLRDAGVLMGAGQVWIKGPQGRRYRNAAAIDWTPYGETTVRVTFEAEHPGWIYDLEFLGDADGLLMAPQSSPPVPWTSRVGFPPESLRAGNGSTIAVGSSVTVTDAGSGDVFNAGDVGRYLRIADAVDAANRGRVARIVGYEQALVDSPPGSGLFTSTVTLDAAGEAWPLRCVVLDDGGVLTTQTAAVALLPAVPVVNDAVYFGLHVAFTSLVFTVDTAITGELTLAWEYWNGAAWVSVGSSLVDGTATWRQSGSVSWEMPAGWASSSVNGVAAYWLRARADTATAPTGGEASVVYASAPYGLVAEAGTVTWQVLRWSDLGFAITRMTCPAGGREDTLSMLGAERKVHPIAGESEDEFRYRAARRAQAVSPIALHSALNRVLAPYGLRGRVMDVQTDGIGGQGFPGMFYDAGADSFPAMLGFYDLYGVGEPALPTDYFLPIARWQATRHFWVMLPPSNLGDFGAFYDVGGYYSETYYDGYAVVAQALYQAAYEALAAAKLFGVSMTFMFDESLLIPC